MVLCFVDNCGTTVRAFLQSSLQEGEKQNLRINSVCPISILQKFHREKRRNQEEEVIKDNILKFSIIEDMSPWCEGIHQVCYTMH